MEIVRDQMAYGPRPTGSEASNLTGDYILSKLNEYGWSTETQEFTYRDTSARNLVGIAGDPNGPIFLLGAHYDTRREADQDVLSPLAPVPGANDGASGVAVLLELARVLDLNRVHGQVWLVFFDAEDNGHLDGWDWIVGSTVFANQLDVIPSYAIVVDMVGDASQDIYLEGNSDPVLQGHLWEIATSLGYQEYLIPELRHTMIDDHIPFQQRGIPSVDIIDFEYSYWHTTGDTEDKLSPISLERVGRVLEVFLESGGDYPVIASP
jgi:Zn-dependent M28 family amino/carboxypeptidase